jgi:hypothetical protein
LTACCEVLRGNDPVAFSLNLSPDVEAAALRGSAKTVLQDRLRKGFKRYGLQGMEFGFIIEFTPEGRLHIHGIVANAGKQYQLLRAALASAGGTWAGAGTQYQVDVVSMWYGPGWARYLMKGAKVTRRKLGQQSVLSISRGLRRAAEDYWESLRTLERSLPALTPILRRDYRGKGYDDAC